MENNVIVGAGNEADKRIHTMVKLNDRRKICEFIVGNYEESIAIQIWKGTGMILHRNRKSFRRKVCCAKR